MRFGWNLSTCLLAAAAGISLFVFRDEVRYTIVRMPIDPSDDADESSDSISTILWLPTTLAVANPGSLLAYWQAPESPVHSSDGAYDISGDHYPSFLYLVQHKITFLPSYYGSFGMAIALLVIGATGIRHSIADTKDVEEKSRSTGSPVARLRFAAANRKELGTLIVAHFESHGYRLDRQTSGQWVFVRGTKIAGTYSFDIREYHTTVTVLTSFAREGWLWFHCVWSVRTMGAWITKKDIATLEGEGHELESMLKTEEAASPTLQVPDAPSATQMHDSSAPAVDTPTQLTTPPPIPAAPPANSTPTPQVVAYDSASGQPIDFDEIRAEVDGPSLAMIVVGMLMMLGHGIAVGICMSHPIDHEMFWLWVPGAIAGLGVLVGGICMRSLASRGMAQLGVIFGYLPVSPGLPLILGISIWAQAVLNRPHVRKAFIRRNRELQSAARGSGQVDLVEVESDLSGPSLAMTAIGMLMMIGHGIAFGICLSSPFDDELAWLAVPGIVVGFGMFIGGLQMRSLLSRGWAQLGVIAGFIPASPGWIISMVVSIWANNVLSRPDVRLAFLQRRRERSKTSDIERQPHYSRKAIFGALWAGLFVLALLGATTLTSVRHVENSNLQHSRDMAESTTTWAMLFSVPILLAPVGTTILGCIALSDIKHSQGRITGRGLALADATGFPLLVLNGAIFGTFLYVMSSAWLMDSAISIFLSLSVTAAVGGWLSFEIIQRVWRTSYDESDGQRPPGVEDSKARTRFIDRPMSWGAVLLWLAISSGLVIVIGAATYQNHRSAWGYRYSLEDASPGVLIPNSGAYALRMTAFASGHAATMMSEGQVKRDHVELEIEDADYHYQLIVTLPDLEFTYDYPGVSSRSFERGFSKAVLLDWMRGCGVDVRRPGIETEVDAIFEMVRGAFHTPLGDLVDRQLFEASVGDISFSISHEEEWAHLTWCLVVGGAWLIATLLLTWVWNGLPERRGLTRFAWGVAWILFPMLLAFGPWFYWEGFDKFKQVLNRDPYGRTPLLLAVVHEDADEVRRLLDRGAEPNDGWRSLFCAAGLGNVDITRQLLVAGAEVDAPGDFGITPLMFASALGHDDVVQLLINAGANVNLQDYGVTREGYSVINQYFVGVGTPGGQEVANWWPGDRQTPLILAIREGHADVTQTLLESHASSDITDSAGKSAADYVNESDDLEIKHIFEEFLQVQQAEP